MDIYILDFASRLVYLNIVEEAICVYSQTIKVYLIL